MTDNSPITEDHRWYTNTKKTFIWVIDTDETNMDVWTLLFQLRQSKTSEEVLIQKTHTDMVVDKTAKTITLVMQASDTVDLEPGTYAYGLKRTDDPDMLAESTAVLQQGAVH